MSKMKFGCIGLKFDIKKDINECSINLPKAAKILSVCAKENDETMWISYMAPSEFFQKESRIFTTYPGWTTFYFLICKCNYNADINIDEYKYIDNINIDNDTFAVFYKKNN